MNGVKNKWMKKIVTFGGDALATIFGGMLGAKWAETSIKTEILKQTGDGLKKHLTPNREEVMKELLRLGDDGTAIVELLQEANREKGFIKCGSKRYPENWIVNMLLKIKLKDRQWEYALLNEMCKNDRGEFFTLLEILCNDGLNQYLSVVKDIAKDLLKRKKTKKSKSKNTKFLKKADREAARIGRSINRYVNNPGWFGRLANKLIK